MTSSRPLELLLIQLRSLGDPMATHELKCLQRRCDSRPARFTVINAIASPVRDLNLGRHDAVMIGGSGQHSVHHPDSQGWVSPLRHVVDQLLRQRIPAFGICFGHQLLAYHLGAQVVTDPERTEIGTVELRLTETGLRDPVFRRVGESFRAQTGHSDSVVELPDELCSLVEGQTVEYQAFKAIDAPFYSTQFHPDLTGAEARERYLAYQADFQDVTDEATQAKAARFRIGADEASVLLRWFVDEVVAYEVEHKLSG